MYDSTWLFLVKLEIYSFWFIIIYPSFLEMHQHDIQSTSDFTRKTNYLDLSKVLRL